MTAMMRRWWGLDSILSDANQKERTDHRHHAIDAAVTAVTDRGLLQRVARAAARSETEDRSRLMSDTPEPWEGFRDDLRDKLAAVTVSHRPDHGTEGELHEATNYGLVADPDAEGGYNLVYRKPLISLNENEAGRIRDLTLRQRVLDHLAEGGDGKLEDRLRAFAETNGVHRVRLLKKEQGVIGMADRSGHVYRAVSPGDNHHIDVLALPDGSWTAWAVTVFDANRAGGSQPPWKKEHPAARRVMRLHKGDLLKLEREGSQQVMRVVRLEPSAGRVRLAGHLESGNLEQRHKDPDDPFRWTFAAWARLSEWRARKLFVDEMGRVRDPGFKQ
jgi:CRISPR-associated endonuclease Csn1